MDKKTLKKYLPNTSDYIDSVIENNLIERGEYLNYVTDEIILNSQVVLSDNEDEANACLDSFIYGYLVGLDKLNDSV